MVRIIIREGQNVNVQTQHLKNTPLHIAAFNGHFLIVKYLLEQGANPIISNREGLTMLNFAEKSK
jgi:ankyrin repeat protein